VRFGDGGRDDVSAGGAYTHMTLWARDAGGMHNLFRMQSLASLEGFFHQPRVDRELLSSYGNGVIGTTGCPSGEVQTLLRLGQYRRAVQSAAELRDILGEGNLFVEVMDHGLDVERRVRGDLLQLARDLRLPLVATNDLHYTHAEDANTHAALLCIQSGSTLAAPKFRFDSNEFYLKTPEQMRNLFRDLPEACDNTLRIAEMSDPALFTESAGRFMPHFPVPEHETEASWFVQEVDRGLHDRYPAGIPAEVRRRAADEIAVVVERGYAGYFLMVAELTTWARGQGIRVGPGRGSGAGSMCAYALRITGLDPIKHGLIFERFLNPDRPSMPDFDVDVDDRRRGEVLQHAVETYGADRVALIATFGTIKARQAIRDAARVLGQSHDLADRVAATIPAPAAGKEVALRDMFYPGHGRYQAGGDLRELVQQDPAARQVVEAAKRLEGIKRQWGVHAAGVIMASEPLIDLLPIMKRQDDGALITQFDYPACEQLGLVKLDVLGLRNLSILESALDNLASNGRPRLVLEDLPLDDARTFRQLASGDTLGVFQLDSGPIRKLLRSLQPDTFTDICALGALYRPGPMGADSHNKYARRKAGREPITPIHPELAGPLDDILGATYGLIVYQEQVMEIAQRVAGYSLGQADLLRRAMGKKKPEVLAAEYVTFARGMSERGYSPAAVEALWRVLVPFSDYAFNKSHAAAYGMISYWTAYLKANHPVEFMAALLSATSEDRDRLGMYLTECRRLGISVLAPDVNESGADFTPVGGQIRFGLTAIRGVGDGVVEQIASARGQHGNFASFTDFLDAMPAGALNKTVVAALIDAGAFDSLGHSRRGLATVYEQLMHVAVAEKRHQAAGDETLFGNGFGIGAGDATRIPMDEWDRHTLLRRERKVLGRYVSGHPLDSMDAAVAAAADARLIEVVDAGSRLRDGAAVRLVGVITDVDVRRSRRGEAWARVGFDDNTATVECIVFPRAYAELGAPIPRDGVCQVFGTVSRRDDDLPTVFVNSITEVTTTATSARVWSQGANAPPAGALVQPGPVITTAKSHRTALAALQAGALQTPHDTRQTTPPADGLFATRAEGPQAC